MMYMIQPVSNVNSWQTYIDIRIKGLDNTYKIS